MTDDINNYTFDFETEVTNLRQSIGPKVNDILFIEAVGKSSDIKLRTIIGEQDFIAANAALAHKWATSSFKKESRSSSIATKLTSNTGDHAGYFICLREKQPFSRKFGAKNTDLMNLFTLYHETAHGLIYNGPRNDGNHPFLECAADAYTALLLLQRFGPEAKYFLSKISWSRSFDAVNGDTSHLSTFVLDKIIADSAHQDFSKLSSDETIKLAETYAKKWTPKIKTLSAMRGFFKQRKSLRYSELLEESLASPSAAIAYTGANFFQPFLQPQGAVFNGQKRQLDDTARQAFAAAIDERAKETTLHDIFRKAKGRDAETPIADLLKVIQPGNQHAFVANF
jgi:hypothetical protein